MNKIIKYLLLQIILAGCVSISNLCFAIEGFWIPKELNWKTPDVNYAEYQEAYINILYFKNNGDFKMFSGLVTGGKTGILNRVVYGYSIFEGIWKEEKDNMIAITYRLVSSTKGIRKGEKIRIPGEDINEYLILDDASKSSLEIRYKEEVYIRSDDRFTEKEKEIMSKPTYEKWAPP